jgi:hypothetical protein
MSNPLVIQAADDSRQEPLNPSRLKGDSCFKVGEGAAPSPFLARLSYNGNGTMMPRPTRANPIGRRRWKLARLPTIWYSSLSVRTVK